MIEDDRELAAMVGEYLGARGFEVLARHDAASGLEELRSRPYAALLLDVMLPDLDGFECCRRIRADSDIPILMLTARGDDTDRIVGLEIGADELRQVREPVRWWSKKKQPVPIFLSREEIQNAHDAFAIEFLDMRAAYRILHGEDVVADIAVEPEHHRHQVEHELRSRLLRLRGRYVAAQEDRRELTRLLVESLPSFATLLRHALILNGDEPPVTKREIFQRAAEQFSISAKPFEAILAFREGAERLDSHDIHPIFGDYLLQITKTAEAVDKL